MLYGAPNRFGKPPLPEPTASKSPFSRFNDHRKKDQVEQNLLNKAEQILFVVINDVVVTCHYPYAHSKQFQKRQFQDVFRKKRRRSC